MRNRNGKTGYELFYSDKTRNFLGHFGIFDGINDPIAEYDRAVKRIQESDQRYITAKYGNNHSQPTLRCHLLEGQWVSEDIETIYALADFGEMRASGMPAEGTFDLGIAIGAVNQAPKNRLDYIFSLMNTNAAHFRHIAIGGNPNRLIDDTIRKNAENYAPLANDEFDLCANAARVAEKNNPGTGVTVYAITGDKVCNNTVLSTICKKSLQNGILRRSSWVLAVTTPIYYSTLLEDVKLVQKELDIEIFVAGNTTAQSIIDGRKVSHYYSECLRWIWAMLNSAKAGL